jgi:hypothetical protein
MTMITLLIALSGISSGFLASDHSTDEWRTILAVPEGEGLLTGLQLSLDITPDMYYMPNGTQVTLSGELFNIFGPIPNATIILARGLDQKPEFYQELTTDEDGRYSYSDPLNETEIIRYQTWFLHPDTLSGKTVSRELEIVGIPDGKIDEKMGDNFSLTTPGLSADVQLSNSSGFEEALFSSDQVSVTISGIVTGYQGPVSDATVRIIQLIPDNDELVGFRQTASDGSFELTDLVETTDLPVSYQISTEISSDELSEVLSIIISTPVKDPEPVQAEIFPKDMEGVMESSGLSLVADSYEYISGQNVTFTGTLVGSNGIPLPYSQVWLEMEKIIRDNESASSWKKIGDTLLTDRNGTFNCSFYLTESESLIIRAISSDEQGNRLTSNPVTLIFNPEFFSPHSRERKTERNIAAYITSSIISTGDPVTISGWFSDGYGDPIQGGRLNLYWYNFADRIWDRYQMGTESLTSKDGFFAFNVTGPKLAGVSYFATVSKWETNRVPLFSSVLVLTVRDDTVTLPSVLPTKVTGVIIPIEVQVDEQAEIIFTLTDYEGNPLSQQPLQVFFSQDGFTWYMNANGNVTTSTDGTISLTDTPWQPGFHYYRGFFEGSDLFGPSDSGIIPLPVIDLNTSSTHLSEDTKGNLVSE